MRNETYDKDGLAVRVEITRDAGVATYRQYQRPNWVTPAVARAATPVETSMLEAEEREDARTTAWAIFKAEAAKSSPDVKTLATLLEALLVNVMPGAGAGTAIQ